VSAPVCPRCGSAAHVVRGVPGLQPGSWSCRSCLFKVKHLDRAVLLWRLAFERGTSRSIRITRRAA
jgi:ribosomal protein L37AE/L43A